MGTIRTLELISYTVPDTIVSLSDRLDGTFVAEDYLRLERLRQTAAPEVSHAVLSFEYGKIVREDKVSYTTYPPQDITGKFCKVEVPTAGTIVDESPTDSSFKGDTGLVDSDGYYTGMTVKFTSGPLIGESQEVTGYTGITRSLATAAFSGAPEDRDKFVLLGDKNDRWWGIIEDDARDSFGTSPVALGNQQFVAYGLERLLEKVVVDSAIVKSGAREFRIESALPFNVDSSKQFQLFGNRSPEELTDNTAKFGFSAAPAGGVIDLPEPDTWDAIDAIDYLLGTHGQTDSEGTEIYPWVIVSPVNDPSFSLLTWYEIAVRTEGKHVRQIINELVPRFRLVGYHVKWNDTVNQIELHPFSFNSEVIPMGSLNAIPQNNTLTTLDFDEALDVESAIVRNSVSHKSDLIIARGERRTSTFTAFFATELLESAGISEQMVFDWTSTQQGDYNTGVASLPGHVRSSTDEEELDRDVRFRGRNDMNSVFRRFRMSSNWDGAVLGFDTGQIYYAAPPFGGPDVVLVNGIVLDGVIQPVDPFVFPFIFGQPLSHLRKRWLPWMPLREDSQYDGSKIEDGVPNSPGSAFQRPFLLIGTSAGNDPFRVEFGHRLSTNSDRSWSVRLSVRDSLMGVEVDVTSGDQHFIAQTGGGDFSPLNAVDSRHDPATQKGLDYRTISITGTIELDSRIESFAVIGTQRPPGEVENVKIVNVSGMRLDYVVPSTVVDVDGDGQYLHSEGGFVRDDRVLLNRIADMSAEWYGRDRQALTLTYKQLRTPVDDLDRRMQIGDLITTISTAHNKTDVNSVVTAIDMDVLAGETTIETQYAVADFA